MTELTKDILRDIANKCDSLIESFGVFGFVVVGFWVVILTLVSPLLLLGVCIYYIADTFGT